MGPTTPFPSTTASARRSPTTAGTTPTAVGRRSGKPLTTSTWTRASRCSKSSPGRNDMPSSPLISVVIPTRDRADLLRQSLASLVAQTIPPADYEVVVVDDGSSDATVAVCDDLSS